MNLAVFVFWIASFSMFPGTQPADPQAAGQAAPALEIVKLEISMVKSALFDEGSPVPEVDPGTLQRQKDTSAPTRDTRIPSDPVTPRYDPRGQVIRPSTDARTLDPKLPRDRSNRYRYVVSLTVSNAGDKKIASVSWDYVLIDPESNKELRRIAFRNKKTIAPGETAMLMQDVKPSSASRSAEITRIQYADGSIWQRPRASN